MSAAAPERAWGRGFALGLMAGFILFMVAAWAIGAGPARVIDGDTIAIDGVVVRLFGIDAPEIGQTCVDAYGGAYDAGTLA